MTDSNPAPSNAIKLKRLALILLYFGIAALVYFYAPAGFWYLVLIGTFLWNLVILIIAGINRFYRQG